MSRNSRSWSFISFIVMFLTIWSPHAYAVTEDDLLNAAKQSLEPSAVSEWAYKDIVWMIDRDILPLELQSQYTSNITREEFSMLIMSVLDYLTSGKVNLIHMLPETTFDDTDHPAVYRAYGLGVVNGVSETRFMPERHITRQEAAVMLANLLKSMNSNHISTDDTGYVDQLSIAGWALDAVHIVSNAGLFQGSKDGFRPEDQLTREQAVSVMRRLIKSERSSAYVSLRGQIPIRVGDLGTEEEVKQNVARPIAVLIGNDYVKFAWTEANPTVGDLLNHFEKWNEGRKDRSITPLSKDIIARLKKRESPITANKYQLEIGTKSDGYLLKISW